MGLDETDLAPWVGKFVLVWLGFWQTRCPLTWGFMRFLFCLVANAPPFPGGDWWGGSSDRGIKVGFVVWRSRTRPTITKSVEKEQSWPQSSSAHDYQERGYSQSIPSAQSVNTCRWLIIAANLTTILIGTCYQWVIHCYLRIYRNSCNASTPALIFSFFFHFD